jgi:hypothetical protein
LQTQVAPCVHLPLFEPPGLSELLTRQTLPTALQVLVEVGEITQFPLETNMAFWMKPEKPSSGTQEATPLLFTAKTPTPQRMTLKPRPRKILRLYIFSPIRLAADASAGRALTHRLVYIIKKSQQIAARASVSSTSTRAARETRMDVS